MHYGNKQHVHSPDDITVLRCFCGWRSKELSAAELGALGIPWYCDDCGRPGLSWVRFHPSERAEAESVLGK